MANTDARSCLCDPANPDSYKVMTRVTLTTINPTFGNGNLRDTLIKDILINGHISSYRNPSCSAEHESPDIKPLDRIFDRDTASPRNVSITAPDPTDGKVFVHNHRSDERLYINWKEVPRRAILLKSGDTIKIGTPAISSRSRLSFLQVPVKIERRHVCSIVPLPTPSSRKEQNVNKTSNRDSNSSNLKSTASPKSQASQPSPPRQDIDGLQQENGKCKKRSLSTDKDETSNKNYTATNAPNKRIRLKSRTPAQPSNSAKSPIIIDSDDEITASGTVTELQQVTQQLRQTEAEKAHCDKELETARSEPQQTINAAKKEHELETQAMAEKYNQEIKAMKEKHNQEISAAKKNFEQEINVAKERHEQDSTTIKQLCALKQRSLEDKKMEKEKDIQELWRRVAEISRSAQRD